MTLDLHSNQEKFGSFLRATLDVLSQLLELATLHDIGKVNKLYHLCLKFQYLQDQVEVISDDWLVRDFFFLL